MKLNKLPIVLDYFNNALQILSLLVRDKHFIFNKVQNIKNITLTIEQEQLNGKKNNITQYQNCYSESELNTRI